MFDRLISFSIYHRGTVFLLTLMLAIAGLVAFQKLPIDAVPDITNNQVQVNTTIEGLAPEEIERTVTYPVESSMRGLAGVEAVRSITRFGLSQVTVVFKDGVDIYRARQLVSERLQGASGGLPTGAKPQLGPISTGLGEIYHYVLNPKTKASGDARIKQLMELKSLQEWFIKPRLLTVEGVAEVNTTGGFEKQFHVHPNPQKMAANGVHFGEILEALEKVNKNVGGGYIEQTAEQFLVQGVGLLKNIEDIKRVPIKTLETFRIITIADIATVELGKELRTGAAVYNGEEAILGTVMMLLGENSRTVSLRVHEKMQEITKTLPDDVELTVVYNRSDLVNATLGTVEHNLIMGAFLVTVILLLLLGNIRAALITAVTIPLSLLATFLVMKPLGMSGNLMSLGALDFGIIVDGTVFVLDNCVRVIHERSKELKRNLSPDEVKQAIFDATVEIRRAAGFGQLIIVLVFLPIFGLTGVEGKTFIPMAATFAIAVAAAFVLSFTTAPALASLLLKGDAQEKEPRMMAWIRAIYIPILDWSYKRRAATIAIGLASFVVGIGLFMTRGSEFLPQLGEGSFAFQMIRPVNIGLTQSVEYQKKANSIALQFPEVSHIFARIGTSEVATDPMGVNLADTYVMLKPHPEWPKIDGKQRSYSELESAMVDKLEKELPGQNYLASQPIQMRFNELLEGTRGDVAIKVFGPDLSNLVEYAKKTQEVVSKIQGAGDVEIDLAGTSPLLRIEPNEAALKKYNASLSNLLETVAIALGGREGGFIYEGERKFPIVVRLGDEERADLENIRKLPVTIGANITAPLETLAHVKFKETFSTVNRENSNRRTAVLINLRGRDTASFVKEAQAAVEREIKLPSGYYFEWGGNFKNLEEARARLLILAPVALALIFMMLFTAFGSAAEAFLILACVPMALVGGVIGLVLNGIPFSISAGIGFIALSGVAVLNGVVLVNFFNELKAKGKTGKDLVFTGTLVRLRSIMMTGLVGVFGFIPMMVSTGVGAEVQKPLAAVVIGGIISSTLLTLVVLPVLYNIFERHFKGRAAH